MAFVSDQQNAGLRENAGSIGCDDRFSGNQDALCGTLCPSVPENIGGICGNGVTTKTNYLILGSTDYCASLRGAKSSKHKKAEQLIAAGQDLIILPENAFYDMILDY